MFDGKVASVAGVVECGVVVPDLGEHHRSVSQRRAHRQHLATALRVERCGRGVEPVVQQPVALVGVRVALGRVVVGGTDAGVRELTVLVVFRQSQRSVVQLQRGLHETALRVGDGHVVHHLVVAGVVGESIEDVGGFGQDVSSLRQPVVAGVVVDHDGQRVGQLRQVALGPCLLRDDRCQRGGFRVPLDGQQAARLTDLQVQLSLQLVGAGGRECEQARRAIEVTGLARLDGALLQRGHRVGAAVAAVVVRLHHWNPSAFRHVNLRKSSRPRRSVLDRVGRAGCVRA